jgi:peptidyl-prolyl cis-trans isomerase D
MFRSCEATSNEKRQQVGEVLGKKISVQDFQALVDEYQSVIKMTQGRDNLTEEELNQVKDQVWQQFVNNTIMETEAGKLGLTVTDEELQEILKTGTNPMLMQTPFVNQQTGRFDVTQLTKFLADYKKMQEQPQQAQVAEQYKQIYDYWNFIEKQLRQNILGMKYQSLLAQCLLSNPVSAKMAFEAQNQESDIQLATLPYSAIKDSDVEVSESDLKAKYDAEKEMFKQYVESRNIKYVDFQVVASAADRTALMKTINDARQKLESGAAPAEVVRKAQSQIAYSGIAATKRAFAPDIAAKLDSMQVGQVSAPFETAYDNTVNVIKLINKVEAPDSVEYRQIQVGGETAEAAHKTADSIYNALKAGAEFEALAKKYNQTGEKQWLTSSMYENAPSIDADSKAYLTAIITLAPNEVKNVEFSQGNIIVQVLTRKAMVTKYDAAVIKHTIDFSKDTYSQAYNKFSQYVSENKTIEALEKNAEKFGFQVKTQEDLMNSEHNVVGIRATREAMKWIFDAEAGQVSPLYECGSNDHLLVVAVDKIHPIGYRDLDAVKEEVKSFVMRDKKFDVLKEKLAGVKSIAEAEAKGAKIDSVNQISFSSPAFIQSTGSSEPALTGAVVAAKAGEFHADPVKGNNGAFVFQVISTDTKKASLIVKDYEKQLQSRAQQAASRFLQELYQKAEIKDKRYLFF